MARKNVDPNRADLPRPPTRVTRRPGRGVPIAGVTRPYRPLAPRTTVGDRMPAPSRPQPGGRPIGSVRNPYPPVAPRPSEGDKSGPPPPPARPQQPPPPRPTRPARPAPRPSAPAPRVSTRPAPASPSYSPRTSAPSRPATPAPSMRRTTSKGTEPDRPKSNKPTALSRAKADQAAGKNKGKAGADVMYALARFKKTHKWARQKGMGDEAMLVARRLARMGGSMYRKAKPAPARDTGTIVPGIPAAEKKGRIRVPPQPGGRHTPGMRKRTGPTSRNRY